MNFKSILLIIISFAVLFLAGCKKDPKEINKTNLEIYEGYLMDQTCGLSGKGMDNTNVLESPGDHTKHCLLYCEASGFGLMKKDKETDSYVFIKFDKKGHDLAKNYLLKSREEKGFSIKVEGMTENGILKVENLTGN